MTTKRRVDVHPHLHQAATITTSNVVMGDGLEVIVPSTIKDGRDCRKDLPQQKIWWWRTTM
jgi:hypothetical protein